MSALPVLETERLRLRGWSMNDLPALHALWSDPEVIWWGASQSLDESRRVLERFRARSSDAPAGLGFFAAELAGEVVGNFMLVPAPYADGVEIGFHLHKARQGQGLATEGALALVHHAFAAVGLERVVAAVVPDNASSRRVLEKLGFDEVDRVMHGGLEHLLLERRRGSQVRPRPL